MDFKSETNNSEQLSEADRSTGEEWQPEEIAAYLTEKEPEAVQQLADFLLSKGVDSTIGGFFTVHLRSTLKSKRRSNPLGYAVHYTSTDGFVLESKHDVLAHAKLLVHQAKGVPAAADKANIRQEIHTTQKQALNAVKSALPVDIGEGNHKITVINFGTLKIEKDAPEFHNIVQVYPVGYKCRMHIPNIRSVDGKLQAFDFEILDVDGGTEFMATHCNNGTCFRATTEEALFKKVEALGGFGGPSWGHKSVFNLEIELLLEGMEDILHCIEYQFHEERGYPHTYQTQETMVENRNALLANSARERRKARRDAIKLLSPEEQQRCEAIEKKRLMEEKEASKLEAIAEREQKKMDAAAFKAQKEQSSAVAKRMKEEARKEKAIRDEQMKKEEKERKDIARMEEKYRNVYRRGVKTEVRKLRDEALLAVLASYDREEGADVDFEALKALQQAKQAIQSGSGSSKLESILRNTPNCNTLLLPQQITLTNAVSERQENQEQTNWDAAIFVANTLHVSRHILGLQCTCTLESLIQNLSILSMPYVTSASSSISSMQSNASSILEEKISTLDPVLRQQSQAQYDQIMLTLIRSQSEGLHGLLELLDKVIDPEGGERGGKKEILRAMIRLPLNQLTWPEHARMLIIANCFKQLRGDSNTTTALGGFSIESQFAIRGGRGTISWHSAKNTMRRIRYRWFLRNKLVLNPAAKDISKLMEYTKPNSTGATPLSYLHNVLGSNALRFEKPQDLLLLYTQQKLQQQGNAAVEILSQTQLPQQAIEFLSNPPMSISTDMYESEQDIINPLINLMTGAGNYSEAYQRCAAVLLRVLQLTASKFFIWAISRDEVEEYFDVIKRPLMLSNVATHLVLKAYDIDNLSNNSDSNEMTSEQVIYTLFYEEMQTVFNNCFIFNTEIQNFVAHGHRAQLCFFRYFQRWILSKERPLLTQCKENICLLSGKDIESLTLMKCGHCSGQYHLDALSESYLNGNIYVIPVSQELVDSNSTEWVCPFCMEEDEYLYQQEFSLSHQNITTQSGCNITELGPSLTYPWMLNPFFSNFTKEQVNLNPTLQICLQALTILSDSTRSNVLPIIKGRETRTIDEIKDQIAMDTAASKLQLWTLQERLTVLHALVLCYLSTPKLTNHIQFLQDQMERLKTIAGHTSFKEGEFLKIVNELIGDHETSQCQQMLDEIAGDNNRTPRALASRIFEGRCTQCKGSTFPEDNVDSDHEGAEGKPKPRGRGKGKKNMKNTEDLNSTGNHSHESKKEKSTHHGSEESQSSQQQTTQSKEEKREQRKKKHEVILCDGCNAESHLRCLGLNNVPAGDYYCKECSLRYQARPTSDDLPVDDLDQYRDNKIEEEFHNRKIDRLAAQEGHTVLTVDTPLSPEIDTNTLECMYCRMSETELCSPMVFSQSRIEHEEHVKASKNAQRAVTHLGVNVTFAVNGKKVLPPPIRAPYFPTITSMESAQLMELQTELQGNTSSNITTITAPVPLSEQPISKFAAHQICALEMYRARASKYKNLLRRKRRRVVSLVLSMAGISVRPLGQDDKNRIYWKFPSSQALFICSTMGSAGEAQKLAFHELVQSQRNQHSTTLATPSVPFVYKMPEWKIITEPTQILALSNALGPSTEEQALRRNLVDTFTRRNGIYKNISAKKNTASIEGIIKNTTAEEQALSATDMQVDSIDLIEEMKTKEQPGNDSMNVVSFKDTRDQTPVELVLLDGKSMSIEQEVVIAEESAFQDQPVNELGEEPDFGSEFMVFGKKFYGVVLLNAAGRKLKLPNGSVTVTCQVHLSGVSRPLASTPLTDAWSDGAYYFSTAVFLRSGEYIISFVVEGTNAVNISPLIYPVTVTSRATKSGPSEALIRLNAWTWLLQADRRILVPRIKRSILQMKIQRSHINEFEYVRAALLAVFAALPMGCLPPIIVEDRKSSNNKKTAAALAAEIEMRGEDITEAAGWTEELEALWYDVVTGATVPLQLMEAVLLLESCITKSKWYSDLGQRLMSTLPAPHAALRCVTLPTVALRIFSLDRALCYDKVMDDPRSRRSGMATETSTRTLNKHVPTAPSAISQAISNPVTALKATQNNTNRGQKRRLESGSGNDDEEAFNRDLAKAMAASVRDANRDKRNTNYTHSDIHGDKRLNQIAAKVNAPHTLLADESTATEESEASEEEEDRMFSTDSED